MFHDVAEAFSEDQVELRRLAQLHLELATAQQQLVEHLHHQRDKAEQLARKYVEAIPAGHLIEAVLCDNSSPSESSPSKSPLPLPHQPDQQCLEQYLLHQHRLALL
jgi:hypothetical protein